MVRLPLAKIKWIFSIKSTTLAPVYDEQFQFNIMAVDMSLVSIEIMINPSVPSPLVTIPPQKREGKTGQRYERTEMNQ